MAMADQKTDLDHTHFGMDRWCGSHMSPGYGSGLYIIYIYILIRRQYNNWSFNAHLRIDLLRVPEQHDVNDKLMFDINNEW